MLVAAEEDDVAVLGIDEPCAAAAVPVSLSGTKLALSMQFASADGAPCNTSGLR